jgi:ABC-2 type transport system permease protein
MIYLVRIFAMVKKEFLSVLKDKKNRFVLIVPPIIQLFIFTYAATLDVRNVPIGILDLNRSEKSYELTQRFASTKTFSKIVFLDSEQKITPFINNQEGIAVLYIDANFSKNIDSKKNSDLLLILDGRRSNAAQIIAGYIQTIVSEYNTDLGFESSDAELIPRNWYNPNLLFHWYNVPCLMGVLTMVVCLSITAMSISREREMGTFDQVLVCPMSPRQILIGKVVPPLFIALFEGSLILLIGTMLFEVPFEGNVIALYLTLFVFSLSIVGVGLFLSSLSSTQQQANLGTFLFLTPSITLSGFATPIENMPHWLQLLTYLNPLKYMLIITKGIYLKNMPLQDVISNAWPLLVIAVLTLTGAGYYFRKGLP